MAVRSLKHFYFEKQIDDLLEREKEQVNAESKSKLLRQILKQRYGLCSVDECLNPAIYNDMCQVHLQIISKKLRGEGNESKLMRIKV